MKMTTLLLIAAILQVSAGTFAQKVSLSEKNAPISQIFDKIRVQTGYDFLINNSVLKNANPVTIQVKNAELKEVLDKIFIGQPLEYQVTDKLIQVKIKEKSFFAKVIATILAKDIQGRVLDQDGNPLGGATIRVLGTDLSTTSYETGYFNLSGVAEDATIRVSYIGYISQVVKVSSNLYAIKLIHNDSKLDEIKIIAYGTTTQRTSTGDISTVTAADIQKQPVNNILDALAGRVAGLQITPTSGIIGAAPNVLVQGRSSLGNAYNVPLYLVDGVPSIPSQNIVYGGGIDNQSLNLLFGLNPQDVESISVLKDADATAIYGSRGANGVIIITTKRGKTNGVQVNLNAYTGIQKVGHFMDLLNIHQYDSMRREAFKNDGITPVNDANDYFGYAPDLFQTGGYDTTKLHNWQKEFLGKTAASQDVNFSLSGGSGNTHFYLSSAYHREGSVMPGNTESTRKSFLSRVNHVSEDKKFNMDVQANYSTTSINVVPTDLTQFIGYAPSYQLYSSNGAPNWSGTGGFPLAFTLQKYSLPTVNFGGSVNLAYEFIPGLKAKINAGFNKSRLEMSYQQPLNSLDPEGYNPVNTLIIQNSDNNNWIAEPQLEYVHNFKKHHLELLAGATFQKTEKKELDLTGTNFANDALIGNIGSAGTTTLQSNNIPYAYNAVFARATYNYNQEFLADLTFRRDGSSRFGPDKKFGNFGALGIGWVFTQEKAITDALPFLSFGKIRATYGITGNDQIIEFGYISTVSSTTYSGGYNGQPVLEPTNPANPNLQWETNKKLQAGLELGFFKDRIFLSASYFRNRTGNQLINIPLSTQSGFYYYVANSPALVQNKGLEFELTSHNLTGKFTWNTSFNLTRSVNKLISYPNFDNSYYSYQYAIGQSINVIKAYKLTGLDKTGQPVFADINHDGTVDQNDRILAGDNDPFYGGIKNDFGFAGFNFGFFIQYDRYRGTELYLPNGSAGSINYNVSPYSLGRWQNPGDEANTIIPAFTTGYQNYLYNNSDQLISTSNIFRLSNASLSYTIPASVVKSLKMSRLQVYLNGQNLYVWDRHKAYELDPQTGNSTLPPLRTIVFGINATF